MPNKGQIISFFIVLIVITAGTWQAVSHGDSLKQDKNLIQPAFIIQQPQQKSSDNLYPAGHRSMINNEPSDNDNLSMINNGSKAAFILIDDGSGDPKEFMLEISASTTAIDLLQEACLTSGFALESDEYDFGVFVESINNKRNTQDDKYWLFYINNELSQLTPDKVVVNPADKIEFIFTSR